MRVDNLKNQNPTSKSTTGQKSSQRFAVPHPILVFFRMRFQQHKCLLYFITLSYKRSVTGILKSYYKNFFDKSRELHGTFRILHRKFLKLRYLLQREMQFIKVDQPKQDLLCVGENLIHRQRFAALNSLRVHTAGQVMKWFLSKRFNVQKRHYTIQTGQDDITSISHAGDQ